MNARFRKGNVYRIKTKGVYFTNRPVEYVGCERIAGANHYLFRCQRKGLYFTQILLDKWLNQDNLESIELIRGSRTNTKLTKKVLVEKVIADI